MCELIKLNNATTQVEEAFISIMLKQIGVLKGH